MLPNTPSSEYIQSPKYSSFSAVRTRPGKMGFSSMLCHLCHLALFSPSHGFLCKTSLLLAITICPVCHLAPSFPENTIVIPPKIPSIIYTQSQTYSLYKNNVRQSTDLFPLSSALLIQLNFLPLFQRSQQTLLCVSVSTTCCVKERRRCGLQQRHPSPRPLTQCVETHLLHTNTSAEVLKVK